jgi:Zn-dependent M28 family amino/carboxypeptidase
VGADSGIIIPALDVRHNLGVEFYNLAKSGSGLTLHVEVNQRVCTINTSYVIAETPGGRADRVVVAGAHLDSVPAGPGINDNGSGSATILEIALQLKKLGIQPANKVRFAFWGGEKDGLVGSDYYVSHLIRARDQEHRRQPEL